MTAEEVFCNLYDKYGDGFNWHMVPLTNKTFVAELKAELGEQHFLYHEPVYAVAKCDSNDDVLFLCGNENGKDIYYVFHLTYSRCNACVFPAFDKITGIENMKKYMENSYILNCL